MQFPWLSLLRPPPLAAAAGLTHLGVNLVRLAPGAWADAVVLTPELDLRQVLLEGELL